MLWGLTGISDFQGVGRFTKNQHKVGLGQFVDLMGKWAGKKDGDIFEKEVETLMHTITVKTIPK